eukprot:3901757-Pyramimonas_sp.AAC.1
MKKAAMRLRRTFGHRPPRTMAPALRRQGSSATAISVAKQTEFSSCIENRAPEPPPAAVLKPAQRRRQVVGADAKEIPGNDEIGGKYLVIVDEASKLTLAIKILGAPA